MDTYCYYYIILISLSFCLFLKSILNLATPKRKRPNYPLPPGPPTIPIIGNFLWLRKSFSELEPILRSFHARFGPIVTVHIGSRPAIFVADRSLTHQALVQNGAVFADRPPPLATGRIDSTDQHNISSAFNGPTWRLLRRNLTSEILHPSRVKSYSQARHRVLKLLVDRLVSGKSNPTQGVVVVDHLRYAMFCLLMLMCIGDEAGEEEITNIEEAQRRLLLNLDRYNTLNFWPALTKILFKRRWEEYMEIRRNQEDVLVPLIRARKEAKRGTERRMVSYVDTLLELELPEEGKRKLNEAEMVSLCSEFLNAGTDTTTTALQWIMASLVKYPEVQEKLYSEIKKTMEESHDNGGGGGGVEVKEEDLPKMKYLKAVVLEGLRRHPPAHFLLPHAVAEDTALGGYLVPKEGTINFMVAEMGWDPRVWEDPMEFNPERFLGEEGDVDLTGSKEVKMMPFGVGRRICPGYVLALLHLEYFVANLVWRFKWVKVDGDDVDLSEKQEFTMVMKYPLRANLFTRSR